VRKVWRFWFLCIAIILPAAAQDANPPTPAYLLRMERQRGLEDACILVRSDGPYHMERDNGEKVDVYEGNLPEDALQRIEHWVGADELFQLTQDKIIAPVFGQGKDAVILAVNRPGRWQNLAFPTPSNWQPLQQSVVPLAKWFDEMLDAKHRVKLREEEARNNCIPPREIKFSTRAKATKPQALPDFLFVLHVTRIDGKTGMKACSVVYGDGRFHHEVKTQTMQSTTVSTAIYEGREGDEDIQQLRTILAASDLQAPRSQLLPSGGLMKDGEIAALTVPDHQKIRTTLFWRYVPEGLMGAKIYDESGMKELGPLTQWITTDIEARSQTPVANGTLNDCVPLQAPE
jgi:hypothetical protein